MLDERLTRLMESSSPPLKEKKKKASSLQKHARHAKKHAVNIVDDTHSVIAKVGPRRERCLNCHEEYTLLDKEKRCTACAKKEAKKRALVTTMCSFRHCPDVECTRNATIKAMGRFFCTTECMKHYKKAMEESNSMRKRGCTEEEIMIMLNVKPVICTEEASDLFGIPKVKLLHVNNTNDGGDCK
jgi:nitrate reductase cytochrome c-type subunit